VKRIVRTAPIEGPWTDADILKNKIKFRMCSVCKVDLTETVECSHCQVNETTILIHQFTHPFFLFISITYIVKMHFNDC
jgi:hypothetical protein